MIVMKMTEVRGEIMLAAADADILGKKFRKGKLHMEIYPSFYGEVSVQDETFISSLGTCTIANLVGKYTVKIAIQNGFVNEDNVLYIGDLPYAQYAKMYI